MSDNNIDTNAPAPVDTAAGQVDDAAPDQQGHPGNAELAKWRHRTKSAEDRATAAELERDAANAKTQAAQRQLVQQRVAGKVAPSAMADFMSRTDLATLTDDETGDLDGGKIDAHTASVLESNPHLAASDPRVPLVAPAEVVSGAGAPGYESTSMLKPTEGRPTSSWAQIFQDGAKGE